MSPDVAIGLAIAAAALFTLAVLWAAATKASEHDHDDQEPRG